MNKVVTFLLALPLIVIIVATLAAALATLWMAVATSPNPWGAAGLIVFTFWFVIGSFVLWARNR